MLYSQTGERHGEVTYQDYVNDTDQQKDFAMTRKTLTRTRRDEWGAHVLHYPDWPPLSVSVGEDDNYAAPISV